VNWNFLIESPKAKALSKISFVAENQSDAFGDGEGGYGDGSGGYLGGGNYHFEFGDGLSDGYGYGPIGDGRGGEEDF
jgi:hypothetical protein